MKRRGFLGLLSTLPAASPIVRGVEAACARVAQSMLDREFESFVGIDLARGPDTSTTLHGLPYAPLSGMREGDLWVDTSTHPMQMHVFSGDGWRPLGRDLDDVIAT